MKSIRKLIRNFIMTGLFVLAVLSLGNQAKAYNVSGNDIVEYAKTFVGHPYVYGAMGPSSFDCSGLVTFVYKNFGIKLPHGTSYYAGEKYAKYGRLVTAIEYAQPGDLLFFGESKDSLRHVGIYCGNGTMVNALNAKSGVVVSYLTKELALANGVRTWYTDKFQFGLRVLEDMEGIPKPGEDKKPIKLEFSDESGGRLVYLEDEWRYCVEDTILKEKYGYVEMEGSYFLVANGKVATDINGLAVDPEKPENWYYLSNGQIQTQYTGLAFYDGAWFYIDGGKLDTQLTGFVSYDGGLFYVGLGRIMKEVSGLAQDTKTGVWYFLAEGQVQTQYTGLALYDGVWFYVKEGKLASDYSGIVEYDGAQFQVVNGTVIP